jgi:hypothetical protein
MFGMYLVLNDDFAVKFVHHLEFGYFSWVGGRGWGYKSARFMPLPCTANLG